MEEVSMMMLGVILMCLIAYVLLCMEGDNEW